MFKKLKLAHKLILALLVSVLVATIFMGVGASQITDRSTKETVTHLLELKVRSDIELAHTLFEHRKSNDPVDIQPLIELLSEKIGAQATFFSKEGEDFVRRASSIMDDKGMPITGTNLDRTSDAYRMVSQRNSVAGFKKLAGGYFYTAYQPMIENDLIVGAVAVAVPMKDINRIIDENVKSFNVVMTSLTIIVLVLSSIVAFVFGKKIAKPISLVSSLTQSFSLGLIAEAKKHQDEIENLSKNGDEVGTACKSFLSLMSYMEAKVSAAEQIASGDLTVQIHLASERDQFGNAFSYMCSRLIESFSKTQASAHEVSYEAQTISEASTALSQGATESAASIEEISATMHEVSSQTSENCKNATIAKDRSDSAQQTAARGSAQMQDMVKAMAEINNSSQQIAKIIKTIDEIAFQTNLLALNAAVEAARAGQHGKGFAVVAEEVRKLAARSAKAAQETEVLITSSVEKVSAGNHIANNTEEALNDILKEIDQVSSLINEIAEASMQQSAGIVQITEGVQQINIVVQRNTALAEETASTAETMMAQADELAHLIGQFKIKDDVSCSFN